MRFLLSPGEMPVRQIYFKNFGEKISCYVACTFGMAVAYVFWHLGADVTNNAAVMGYGSFILGTIVLRILAQDINVPGPVALTLSAVSVSFLKFGAVALLVAAESMESEWSLPLLALFMFVCGFVALNALKVVLIMLFKLMYHRTLVGNLVKKLFSAIEEAGISFAQFVKNSQFAEWIIQLYAKTAGIRFFISKTLAFVLMKARIEKEEIFWSKKTKDLPEGHKISFSEMSFLAFCFTPLMLLLMILSQVEDGIKGDYFSAPSEGLVTASKDVLATATPLLMWLSIGIISLLVIMSIFKTKARYAIFAEAIFAASCLAIAAWSAVSIGSTSLLVLLTIGSLIFVAMFKWVLSIDRRKS